MKTRFAPAPTGYLHLGGARTALFNYLYAQAQGGQFFIRVDDTDLTRSDDACTQDILASLKWLGLSWENMGHELHQSARFDLYLQHANRLVEEGKAYRCYADEAESERIRGIDDVNKRKAMLRAFPVSDKYTIRFKMDFDREFKIFDTVSGENDINCKNLDDFILVRQDGSPTYMLSSVIDDMEMGITNVIRGKEHLTNAYRQVPLIEALGGKPPIYTHIPLINDEDGQKLSKRRGAKGIMEYAGMGILPEAMCNYLIRLGWSCESEIISMYEAKKVFDLKNIRASASRTDFAKLLSINSYYIKHLPQDELLRYLGLSSDVETKAVLCLENLREKANTLNYIIDMANQIFSNDFKLQDALPEVDVDFMQTIDCSKLDFASPASIKLGIEDLLGNQSKKSIFMFMRVALTGMRVSPGLFEVMYALGPEVCNKRIKKALRDL